MNFYDYFEAESLKKRFENKILLKKSIGSDGTSPAAFQRNIDEEIETIIRKVSNFSYRFSPLKEKLLIKNKKSLPRAVYIPTVRDRLVLSALNEYIADTFRNELIKSKSTSHETISALIYALKKNSFDSFIKLDIKNFFPSLDKEILVDKLSEKIKDKAAISLIRKIINRSDGGIAQGLSVASIMASVYLKDLDNEYSKKLNLRYFRYVDDILILCSSSEKLAIQSELSKSVRSLGLKHHDLSDSEKSETGLLKNQSFSYLGYSFSPDKISVRTASVEKLRKGIVQIFTEASSAELDDSEEILDQLYKRINLKITGCIYKSKKYGWLFYFNEINDMELLYHLDWYVKQCFNRFNVAFDKKKIKSFVRSYYKMKYSNIEKGNIDSYIPVFDNKTSLSFDLVIDLEKTTDEEGDPEIAFKKILKLL